MDATVTAHGRIDIVVNNAATALSLPIGQLTPDAWAKVHDVNLRGPVETDTACDGHPVRAR